MGGRSPSGFEDISSRERSEAATKNTKKCHEEHEEKQIEVWPPSLRPFVYRIAFFAFLRVLRVLRGLVS
jgi:hypothetical protein